MHLPADTLQRSPEESARRIALGLLGEARAAWERLADPADAEALHDFRVAIRRLRSTLRAWRQELKQSVSKRDRRALRSIQTATGAGRDAEVAVAWLAKQRSQLGRGQRRGHDWLVERLEERRQTSMDHVREEVRKQFQRIERDLGNRLARMRLEVHLLEPESGPTSGEVMAAKAREAVDELATLLGRVGSAEEQASAHQARISCKRLRYLVEPLRGQAEDAHKIVKRCKRLQDILGDMNDAHVLREELGVALEDATREQTRRLLDLAREQDPERMRQETRRGERAGLLELARRVQVRLRRRFEELEKEWLTHGIHTLVEDVEGLARQLESGQASNVEIERKYLLRRMPRLPEGAEFLEIDQGWIPGSQLRERVRRTRRGDELLYHRAIKFGKGVRRIEIEEPTTKELFDRLWLLTRGCRVRKRRYLVREGSLLWEIDQFRDRGLVLAEVELPSPAARPKLPDWLEAVLVREVTDDGRYTNLRLGETPGRVPDEPGDEPSPEKPEEPGA